MLCYYFFSNLIVFCALRTPLQRSEKLLAAQYVKWKLSLALWPCFSEVLKPLTQDHANFFESALANADVASKSVLQFLAEEESNYSSLQN